MNSDYPRMTDTGDAVPPKRSPTPPAYRAPDEVPGPIHAPLTPRLGRAKRAEGGERGSLALEQVLFIGAVVALTSGVYAFYQDLGTYFTNFTLAAPPSNFGAP
ncbi:MAG: hypothetical protein IT290_00215 [Deltaproteobacteria bacterium]|nr:hypothetical protein [Deltaproteobacteria bacterium]